MALPAESRPLRDEYLERLKREEVFALQEAVMRADHLVTHESPDLDALVSVALGQLYRRFNGASRDVPVSFVAGNVRDFQRGVLALDIGEGRGLRSTPSGGFMLKASTAGGSSSMAVARILRDDDFRIIEPFVQEISTSDEDKDKGTIERIWSKHRLWPHGEDRNALMVTSIFDMFQSLRCSSYNFELYDLFLRLMEGVLIRGHRKKFSKERNPWDGVQTYYGGRLAVLPIGASIYQAKALEQQGVEVSLYTMPVRSMRDTWSMAVHRADHVAMNLAELFQGRMGDFPKIYIGERLVGWGVKGGGLKALETDARLIRDRFIARVKNVLGPWYSSQH
jgi:hypothetical protein